MKRNPRLFSMLLPLFAVVFIMAAAFPASVLATEIGFQITNNSHFDVRFGAYNGKDKNCTIAYEVFKLPRDGKRTIHCDDAGTTGQCQLYAMVMTAGNPPRPVKINSKLTGLGDGCKSNQTVNKGQKLTCFGTNEYWVACNIY